MATVAEQLAEIADKLPAIRQAGVEEGQTSLEQIQADLQNVIERVEALEEGGGSGGKLYRHDYFMIINYNHNGDYYTNQLTFEGTVYSSSDTELTLDDVLNLARFNGFLLGSVVLDDGLAYYEAFCLYIYRASSGIGISAKCIDKYDGSYIDYTANIYTTDMRDIITNDTVTEV